MLTSSHISKIVRWNHSFFYMLNYWNLNFERI
jgi:hypothetical protein